jgi:hypothetical protein
LLAAAFDPRLIFHHLGHEPIVHGRERARAIFLRSASGVLRSWLHLHLQAVIGAGLVPGFGRCRLGVGLAKEALFL